MPRIVIPFIISSKGLLSSLIDTILVYIVYIFLIIGPLGFILYIEEKFNFKILKNDYVKLLVLILIIILNLTIWTYMPVLFVLVALVVILAIKLPPKSKKEIPLTDSKTFFIKR